MRARAMFIATLLLSALGTASGQNADAAAAGGRFQISGTAVNALGGQPIARARISIITTSDSPTPFTVGTTSDRTVLQTVTTAADGSFTFKGIQAGRYSLIAEGRGFYRQFLDAHDALNTVVVVGGGKDSENIFFRLHPEAVIFGRVVDEFGDPIRQGSAILFRKGVDSGDREIRQRGSVPLDDQGAFTFGHLEEGTYFVGANVRPWYAQNTSNLSFQRNAGPQNTAETRNPQKENQETKDFALDVAYPITFYPGVTDSEAAEAIEVHAGDRFSADLSVRAVQALHLRVSDRAQVNLSQRVFGDISLPMATQINGGPNGREIVGLVPSTYDVTVRNLSQQELASQLRQNPAGFRELIASVPVGHQRVTVTADGYLNTSDEPGAVSVSGTVKFDDTQSAPSRGSIMFHNRDTSLDIVVEISKSGELQMAKLSPGRYLLNRVNAEGFAIAAIAATGAKVTGRAVDIKGPAPVQLTISMSKGLGKVEGIVMRDDKPLSGAMVVFVPEDEVNDRPLFRRLQSDSDGSFTALRVLPGKYTLLAIENGWDLEWANPQALKPYMEKGEVLEIKSQGKYKAALKVQ